MLRLRPYKKCDAKYIVGWIKDEVSLRKWSSDRYGEYPIENNPSAHGCYKAVGFKDMEMDKPWYYRGLGEAWKVIEMELENKEGM